jgi:hypothetical protein
MKIDEKMAVLQLLVVWLMLFAAYISIAGAIGIATGATVRTVVFITTNV